MSALPDYVQPFADQIRQDEARLEMVPTSDDLLSCLAWRRWSGTITNQELGEFILMLRRELFQPGDHPAGVKLDEIYLRLIKRRRHTRRKARPGPNPHSAIRTPQSP